MSGIFPAFNKPVPGADANSVVGTAISANLTALDEIATRRNLPTLSELIDARTMMEWVLEEDQPMPEPIPPTQWQEPELGLELIGALLADLERDSSRIDDWEATREDLQNLADALAAAARHRARFHLLVDI